MVDFRPDQFVEYNKQDFDIPQVRAVQTIEDHTNSVDALTANPTNMAQYASASHDHTIKLWDANTHSCIKTLQGHSDGIWNLNYLQDGKRLISASVDGSVKFWDTNTG